MGGVHLSDTFCSQSEKSGQTLRRDKAEAFLLRGAHPRLGERTGVPECCEPTTGIWLVGLEGHDSFVKSIEQPIEHN